MIDIQDTFTMSYLFSLQLDVSTVADFENVKQSHCMLSRMDTEDASAWHASEVWERVSLLHLEVQFLLHLEVHCLPSSPLTACTEGSADT